MSLAIQKGFWQDTIIANTRQKLVELCSYNPDIAQSDKRCMLEYWAIYEDLPELLGDRWQPFTDWFMKATSPETISRCLRALKENGTIQTNPGETTQRQEREAQWRNFWDNDRGE